MTTRAEEIAAKEYPDDAFRKADRATKDFPAGPYPGHETELRRAAFIKGYKQGQQDRWIPEGWALVPLVATPEMLLNAGFPASSTGDSTTGQNTWEWFVKSAPSPPNHEQP